MHLQSLSCLNPKYLLSRYGMRLLTQGQTLGNTRKWHITEGTRLLQHDRHEITRV